MKKNEKGNNFLFWQNYLLNIIKRLKILSEKKKDLYIDLHIHSDYSIDSNQSLSKIIERSAQLGLDVIAITDHDSIKVYDDLYHYLINNEEEYPIIIPGVEFTIDNEEYGSQFHILQLMINPKDEVIKKDIKYQQKAALFRAHKQIERLNKNNAMQYFFEKYDYHCSIEEFLEYLKGCYRPISEYKTMMDYIRNKTYQYNISNWDILSKMETYNDEDNCLERKRIKANEYRYLKEKYKHIKDSNTNERFFYRLLATRGADDDFYPEYECMGDLSVNKYNELKLYELNKKYMTFFAHPSDNKLFLLEKLMMLHDNICGIELNKRCKYEDINSFYRVQEELDLIKIIGSDCHNFDSNLHDNMDFYRYEKEELSLLIQTMENFIDNSKIKC